MDVEMLQKMLHESVVCVTFTKLDGTVREMRCTLQESYLPTRVQSEDGDEPRKTNDSVMPVFDIDKKEWRSFRKSSIISFSTEGDCE
jgi:hypothetical protein